MLENRRKFRENRQIQLEYRENIFENSFSILPVLQNLLMGTKFWLQMAWDWKYCKKCLETAENSKKSPNSAKIPRAEL